MEVTETETSLSLPFWDGNSGITYEQLLELTKHCEKDSHPKEETLEALADTLKLTKGCTRLWFSDKRRQMLL